MKRIVVATGNLDKLREIEAIAEGVGELLSQSDFNVPPIEETGLSFVENALLKARHAAQHTGLPALADDSGLEVDALNGAPGIYSARYAGPGATDAQNNEKLLQELANVPEHQRRARYQCIMVYLRHAHDATPIICHGTWEGRILFKPQGDFGFGYDPLFFVPTHRCAAAELLPAVKNQLSHRAKALRQLASLLKDA
ncbi:MAG: RdgB/HAM1 family non-canonical purine NTP pyrophosphatase [Pseudomonadota bacterium]